MKNIYVKQKIKVKYELIGKNNVENSFLYESKYIMKTNSEKYQTKLILDFFRKKWKILKCDENIEKSFMSFKKNFYNFRMIIKNVLSKDLSNIILVKLLYNYDYISENKYRQMLTELANKIKGIMSKEISKGNKIFFSPISDDCGRMNSSHKVLSDLRLELGNNEHLCFMDSIEKIQKIMIDKKDIIMFCDDFSGSGKTFIKSLRNYSKFILDKRIIFCTLFSMESAKKRIDKYLKNNNKFDVQFLSMRVCKSAFENFEKSDNKKYKSLYIRENEKYKLCKKPLGYSYTQSIISFSSNTPNNTLTIFREIEYNNKIITLFPRINKARITVNEMRENKKERIRQINYGKT